MSDALSDAVADGDLFRFMEIDHQTRDDLQELAPLLERALPRIMDEFYAHMRNFPNLTAKFRREDGMSRARNAQLEHWRRLFNGTFDSDYLESVRRVGRCHVDVGLEPSWYLGGYTFCLGRLFAVISTAYPDTPFKARAEKRASFQHALIRAVMFDIQAALSTYLEAYEARKREAMAQMLESFERTVGEVVEDVTGSAAEMDGVANDMASMAATTDDHAMRVASAAEQASSNVQTVSGAAEQLTSSIQEVSQQVEQSNSVAAEVEATVRQTDAQVAGLADVVGEIGETVTLIQDIASRTNLLALNATIEATRAGEAGKGFAVVAGEVKALADQTQKATTRIRERIAAVQRETDGAVSGIRNIEAIVNRLTEISDRAASAVAQQRAAADEIARNAQEAADGTGAVSASIQDVKATASRTQNTSDHVLDAARRLGSTSEDLRRAVATFTTEVRAA